MPVYRVDREGSDPRVVEAKTPAAARAHVAKDEITTTKIGTAEAMRLMSSTPGLMLETAGAEEAEAEQEEQVEQKPEAGSQAGTIGGAQAEGDDTE